MVGGHHGSPLQGFLTVTDKGERPYALGRAEIVPALVSAFSRQDTLQPVVLLDGARSDSRGKPDVMLEYVFYRADSAPGAPFARTKPLTLNGSTLPADFDLVDERYSSAAYAVPLASFPPGSYRLEVKVTDAMTSQSVTRDVTFSVTDR